MNDAKGQPIWIDCEGSLGPTNLPGPAQGMCKMCGQWVELNDCGEAFLHQRDDIVARINRGDFG